MKKRITFLVVSIIMGMNAFSNVVEVKSEPGLLKKNVEEIVGAGNYLKVESIKIKGSVNSADMLTLRRMAGLDSLTVSSTIGKLADLDLREATIVEGGGYYCEDLAAQNNVVGVKWFWTSPTLKSVIIPENTTAIGVSAFDACGKLTKITFNSGLTSIGDYAFMRCYELEVVELPVTVTSIGKGAFKECTSMLELYMPGAITHLPTQAFHSCSSLLYVEFPSELVTIADQVFFGCSSLSDLRVPSKVTNLGGHSFRKCSALRSIVLPKTIKEIATSGFDGCTNLESLTCLAEEPPAVGAYAFLNVPTASCELLVPESSVQFYKLNSAWKVFGTIGVASSIKEIESSKSGISYSRAGGQLSINSTQYALKKIELYTVQGAFVKQIDANGLSVDIQDRGDEMLIARLYLENGKVEVLKICK